MLAPSGTGPAGSMRTPVRRVGIVAGRHVLAVLGRYRYSGAAPPCSDAAVAQLVEHLIRNEGVGGSSPFRGTTTPFHICS